MHPYACYGCEEKFRTYMTAEDFRDLREQGANAVSLNYPGPYQVEAPYGRDEVALGYLDNAVNWAEENDLYVILHFRNGPGKPENSFGGGADETLWYSEEAQEKWVEMWRYVADRYKNRSHVVAYNLMVEPHPELPVAQKPLEASVWNALAQRITNGIREIDKNTPIIVEASAWANPVAFPDLKPTGDSKTIYGFHLYEPFRFTHQGFDWAGFGGVSGLEYPGLIPSDLYEETRYWDKNLIKEFLEPVRKFQEENGVPIFVGEFGCNTRVPSCVNYLQDLLEIFEEKGWGHTIYVWHDADNGFNYEKGVSGKESIGASEYMKIFKNHWRKNEYFVR